MAQRTDQTILSTFETLGLNEKESAVYTTLLTLGKATASTVVAQSGLKRGNTYDILYRLESLGLISKFMKDGKLTFQVESPEKLLTLATNQQQKVKAAEESLKSFLPQLNSQYQLSVGKPTIQYFEGEDGIHEVFSDIYARKDEPVYGCVDLEIADKALPSHIINRLIPLRVRNKLTAYTILGDSIQAKEISAKDKQQLRHSLLANKEKYPLPAEIDVYEDKIAMLTFEKGNFIGLVIQNAALATTMRSLFKIIFETKK